jgi:large subunit ribosomal protein L4
MSSVATFTKSGSKATTPAKLDKNVFDVKVENNDLLKKAYLAYLANGRSNNAVVKTRGLVRGGGRKPWRQKGTGKARFGSIRNPIWRGGGIAFGPTGEENYTIKISGASKKVALRQALSVRSDKIKVIETFECKDGKVAQTIKLLSKIGADRNVLLVVSIKDELVNRATRNIQNVKAVSANYINVYDVLNADNIVVSKKALEIIHENLKSNNTSEKLQKGSK